MTLGCINNVHDILPASVPSQNSVTSHPLLYVLADARSTGINCAFCLLMPDCLQTPAFTLPPRHPFPLHLMADFCSRSLSADFLTFVCVCGGNKGSLDVNRWKMYFASESEMLWKIFLLVTFNVRLFSGKMYRARTIISYDFTMTYYTARETLERGERSRVGQALVSLWPGKSGTRALYYLPLQVSTQLLSLKKKEETTNGA